MAQFRKTTRPLPPGSYRAALRRIRELVVTIEAHAEAQEPHEKAVLTRAIHGLAWAARDLSRRHRRITTAQELRG
jgi:hypothetical protein